MKGQKLLLAINNEVSVFAKTKMMFYILRQKLIFRNTSHIQINIVSPYHAYEKPIQTRSLST